MVGEDGEQLGIVSIVDARQRAETAELDLVEIAPMAKPPVCRIMDYGKFKYGQKRHKQKKHREQKLKEVRMHPKIGEHDKDRLLRQAAGFFEKGDKVQFTMIFRGRERFHQELGMEILKSIIAQFGDKAKVEAPPRGFGPRMTMVLAPVKR